MPFFQYTLLQCNDSGLLINHTKGRVFSAATPGGLLNLRRASVLETENTVSNNDAGNCSTGLGILQIALGVLLVTASAFGYSLMQHAALMIPAMMGAALLFYGAKALLVCRDRSLFRDHHQPSDGMTR